MQIVATLINNSDKASPFLGQTFIVKSHKLHHLQLRGMLEKLHMALKKKLGKIKGK